MLFCWFQVSLDSDSPPNVKKSPKTRNNNTILMCCCVGCYKHAMTTFAVFRTYYLSLYGHRKWSTDYPNWGELSWSELIPSVSLYIKILTFERKLDQYKHSHGHSNKDHQFTWSLIEPKPLLVSFLGFSRKNLPWLQLNQHNCELYLLCASCLIDFSL